MPEEIHPQILNKTLGEILQSNNQAQGIVMKAMQVSPQQFQELLKFSTSNPAGAGMMNMTVGDLFKNGIVQQATSNVASATSNAAGAVSNGGVAAVINPGGQATQISPEQMQQIMVIFQNGQAIQGAPQQVMPQSDTVPYKLPSTQVKDSFFQKLRKWFL